MSCTLSSRDPLGKSFSGVRSLSHSCRDPRPATYLFRMSYKLPSTAKAGVHLGGRVVRCLAHCTASRCQPDVSSAAAGGLRWSLWIAARWVSISLDIWGKAQAGTRLRTWPCGRHPPPEGPISHPTTVLRHLRGRAVDGPLGNSVGAIGWPWRTCAALLRVSSRPRRHLTAFGLGWCRLLLSELFCPASAGFPWGLRPPGAR